MIFYCKFCETKVPGDRRCDAVTKTGGKLTIKSGDYVGMFINRDEQWAAFVHNGQGTGILIAF